MPFFVDIPGRPCSFLKENGRGVDLCEGTVEGVKGGEIVVRVNGRRVNGIKNKNIQ